MKCMTCKHEVGDTTMTADNKSLEPQIGLTHPVVRWTNKRSAVAERSTELLPCPFCGCKPSLLKGKNTKTKGWLWKPEVLCRKCVIGRSGNSVDEVVEWWNRRAGSQ